MKKEEILEASRKENKNIDHVEQEIARFSGSISAAVGVCVCALISLLSSTIADMMLYSPWAIYFSIVSTNWLVRAIRLKKLSDFMIAAIFFALFVLAMIGLISRLSEVRV